MKRPKNKIYLILVSILLGLTIVVCFGKDLLLLMGSVLIWIWWNI